MDWGVVISLFGLGVTIAGVIRWSVVQEGRLNSHDILFVEREKQADDRWAAALERLTRIEQKLDRFNGQQTSRQRANLPSN